MDGEVPVLKFIHNDIRRLDLRAFILRPSFRIGFCPVHNSTTPSVHAHSLCSCSCCLVKPLTVLAHLECVESAFDITLDRHCPEAVFTKFHVECLVRLLVCS